jgi:hypothetical protein
MALGRAVLRMSADSDTVPYALPNICTPYSVPALRKHIHIGSSNPRQLVWIKIFFFTEGILFWRGTSGPHSNIRYWHIINQKQSIMSSARPIWSRKADLSYLAFFVIHIPIIFSKCGLFT